MNMTFKWQHPFTCTIAGPTGCGKTVFVTKFLTQIDIMLDKHIDEIIWCYGVSQNFHKDLPKRLKIPIRFCEGIPPLDEISSLNSGPKVVIIDDLMREVDGNTVDIFTKGSHHRNLSVFNLIQNVHHQGKGHRDMSLNSHYIVYFNNPRDRAQVAHFARQIDPGNPKFIVEAYRDATLRPYGYLLFDLKQSTPEEMRLRTDIFPGEQNIVYVSNKKQYK
jgi:hypothetical protein